MDSRGAILRYKKDKSDKDIAKFIIKCFLTKNFDSILTVVKGLPEINGDLPLETDDLKASFLWTAVLFNDLYVTRELLYRGNCNVNTLGSCKSQDFNNVTPLYVACSLGEDYYWIFRTLVSKSDTTRDSLMTVVARCNTECNCIEMWNWLLFYGANVDDTDTGGNTALHWAILKNKYKCIEYLLYCRADPYIKNDDQENALILFVTKLAQRYDDDDDDDGDDDDIESKMKLLNFFILALEKYNYYFNYNVIYELFGALNNNLHRKKDIWRKSLEKGTEKTIIEPDEKLLSVIGDDKREFKTHEDLDDINSDIDYAIQDVFICQRVLSHGHPLNILSLKKLLNYDNGLKMLTYLLEYIFSDDDKEIYYVINSFPKYRMNCFTFDEVYNFMDKFLRKLVRRKLFMGNEDDMSCFYFLKAIEELCDLIYKIYETFGADEMKSDKLKYFLKEKLFKANLESFGIDKKFPITIFSLLKKYADRDISFYNVLISL